jgi:hypothetical protein
MYRYAAFSIVLGVSASLSLLSAATPAIGVALSQGSILVNDAQTAGNATVFNGNTLQTQSTTSQVRLKDGAEVRFAADSRGKLFTDHVALEKGKAQIIDYAASVRGLSIKAEGKSSATVSMKGDVVEVAALSGNVHVMNSSGLLVANILPGRALDLKPQEAGAAAPTILTGRVFKQGNNFFLTDETSNVTVQLRGGDLREGERVQITGTTVPNATPAGNATQVVNVTNVRRLGGGGAAGAAGAGGAGAGAAAAGAAAGAATASTAVVAGVAAAAAIGTAAGVAATTGPPSNVSTSGAVSPF